MLKNFNYQYSREFYCLQKLDESGAILDAMQMPESDLQKIVDLLKGTEDATDASKRKTP